jgi:DNA modification methylase
MVLNKINDNHKIKDKNYSNFGHSKDLPRHNWYYFKEGFSPKLIEEAIEITGLDKDALIVDPFSGSGTTPLMASLNGMNSVGFEVNPFMSFVAKTKQTISTKKKMLKYKDKILVSIDKGQISPLEKFSTFTNNCGRNKWLFNTDVLRSFEAGWNIAESFDSNEKNLFRLSLLSSVMDNSNVLKDGKCVRYKKNWKELAYSKESFVDTFESRLERMINDLESTPLEKKSNIYLGDNRKNISKKLEHKFQLCVTSPPYLNSFDYTDIYRPELFLGKFVKSNMELRKLRYKTLRSHVQVDWEIPKKTDFGTLYANTFNEIIKRKEELWNSKIPLMIQAYFEDMEKILVLLRKKADVNANLWLVVSTSAYAGVEIPVDLILADIGTRVGWELEEVIVTRHLRNSTQNARKLKNVGVISHRLRESIVILKNTNR